MTTLIVTFLVGVATGAAAEYFAAKFTDQRREQETRKKDRARFQGVEKAIPKLIAEMRADLQQDESGLVRFFYVLPTVADNSRVALWVDNEPIGKAFQYCIAEHQNLELQIALLENNGYVAKRGDLHGEVLAPVYRMTEEFVQ